MMPHVKKSTFDMNDQNQFSNKSIKSKYILTNPVLEGCCSSFKKTHPNANVKIWE